MTHKHNGGPAFPFGQISETTGQPVNGFYDPGMSLRDYFAAKIMASLLIVEKDDDETSLQDLADLSYIAADAMLEARESENDP